MQSKVFVVFFFFAVTLKFFQYRLLSNSFVYTSLAICIALLVLYLLFHIQDIRKVYKNDFSGKYPLIFVLLTFVSCGASIIFWGASPTSLIVPVYPLLSILIYYYIRIKKIDSEQLMRIIVILAITKTIVTLIQQVTYPNIWFGVPLGGEEEASSLQFAIRSGLYRFFLSLAFWLNVIMFFYYTDKLLKDFGLKNLLFLVVAVVGIYVDQSRTMMALCGLVFIFMSSYHKRGEKKSSFLVPVILLAGVAIYAEELFGDLSLQTKDDLNMDYIRILTYKIYLFDFWISPLAVLIGNGIPVPGPYADKLEYYSFDVIYRQDVGIVGSANEFGYIFVMVFFVYLIRIVKYRKFLDSYIVGYGLFSIGYLALYFPINYDTQSNAFFAIFMCIVDYSYNKHIEKFKIDNYDGKSIAQHMHPNL